MRVPEAFDPFNFDIGYRLVWAQRIVRRILREGLTPELRALSEQLLSCVPE